MSKYDVFISYSKHDRPFVEKLAERLRVFGFSVWYDDSLHIGDDFIQSINHALAQSQMVLTVWSNDSVASRWVLGEAHQGYMKNRFAALRIDECEVPVPFNSSNYLQVDQGAELESQRCWEKLLLKLSRLSGVQLAPAISEAQEETSVSSVQPKLENATESFVKPKTLPKRHNDSTRLLLFGGAAGAGTSNTVLTLAASLASHSNVLVIDANPLTPALDVHLGIAPETDFAAMVAGWVEFRDAFTPIQVAEHSFTLLPGRSGSDALADMTSAEMLKTMSELYRLREFDYVLLDCSGASLPMRRSLQALVDRYIVVCDDHPVSMTRAYSDIKLCNQWDRALPVDIIIGRAQTETAGINTFNAIAQAAKTFLSREHFFLGSIPDCVEIRETNRAQKPPFQLPDDHPYREAIRKIGERIDSIEHIPRHLIVSEDLPKPTEPTMEEILKQIRDIIAED